MYTKFLKKLGKYLTPNQITIIRSFFVIPAYLFWFYYGGELGEWTAVMIMTASWYCDHLDGAVARACGLVSDTGKWLDPAVDKIVIYLTFLIFWNNINKAALLLMLLLDIISTFARTTQQSAAQGANWYGKYKLVFQVGVCLLFAIAKITGIRYFRYAGDYSLIIAIILATISVSTRIFGNYFSC